MKKIFLSGFLAGLAMLVVALILQPIFNLLLPSLAVEYANPALFRPWSDPLMSLYFLHPFLVGFILAGIWNKVKTVIQGESTWQKGSRFAVGVWLIATLPGMFISYASFPLSPLIIFSWMASGLVQLLVAGWIYAKMNK